MTKPSTVDYIAIGGLIIANVVTPLGLDPVNEDLITGEIKWLFGAADHLLKISKKEIQPSQPIPIPIPAQAQKTAIANNQLLTTLEDYQLQILQDKVNGRLTFFSRLQTYVKDLNQLIDSETSQGEAAKSNVNLQNKLKDQRLQIIKTLQEMAQTMYKAYGVLITSPEQLQEFLEQSAEILTAPVALAGLVMARVITPLDLEPEILDWVSTELTWLFSAASNFLKIRRGQLKPDQPIVVPIPPQAERLIPQTNNQLLLEDSQKIVEGWTGDVEYHLKIWESKIEGSLKNINTQLNNLLSLLTQEIKYGESGKYDVDLQFNIKKNRWAVAKTLVELVEPISKAYGISVTSPNQLADYLT